VRPDLGRRLLAEFLGTGLLVVAVIGSGIAAARLSPGDTGLELLENAAATAGALVALILAFGPVSGAHFNPVVTLADRRFGGITTARSVGYIAAQVLGGVCGALVANAMFGLAVFEVVATFGLLLTIFAVVRSGRRTVVPFAVAAYIGGAYFFTSSTSFANPAVTIARTLSNTFAGIRPSSVPGFVIAQLGGLVLAVAAIVVLYPHIEEHAAALVLPQEAAP